MTNNDKIIKDCPFLDLLGLKKKEELTEEQRLGKELLEISKNYHAQSIHK